MKKTNDKALTGSTVSTDKSVTRRGALKKAAWTAPVLMTMNVPDRVFAQSAVSPAPGKTMASTSAFIETKAPFLSHYETKPRTKPPIIPPNPNL